MKIGIISDTHGFLDPIVFKAFRDVDEIWHAGDFGQLEVARQLAEWKPLKGVFGNIDDTAIRESFPEDLRFEIEGVSVWITHIAGRPGKYDRRVKKQLQSNPPSVLVCGHSHICHVQRDQKHSEMLYLNPGAAGHAGFHQMRTLLKCRIQKGHIDDLRVIELGPRGRRTASH